MKHLAQLPPSARKLLAALLIIAAIYPAPISFALHYTAAIGLAVAAILLLRAHPAGTHKALTAARIHPAIATLATGHKAATKPEPSYKHAPAAGPEIPVRNHTR